MDLRRLFKGGKEPDRAGERIRETGSELASEKVEDPAAAGSDWRELLGESGPRTPDEPQEAPEHTSGAKSPDSESKASAAGRNPEEIKEDIIGALRTVYDPEIPINIYELGLIYDLEVSPVGKATVRMTLTSPMCPVAGYLPLEVENKVQAIEGVTDVTIDLVWDPPWSPDRMSDAAKLQLGIL